MESDSTARFEKLSTRQLESILRKSLKDGRIPPEDLLAISKILEERDVGKGMGPPDAEAAWNRLLKVKQGRSPGSPPEEKPGRKQGQIQILQRCAIWAVCIFAAASVFFAPQAFGFNLAGTIIRWTADVFHFENVGTDGDGFEGTHLRDDYLADGKMPAEFIPSWLPDGFEKTTEEMFSLAGLDSCLIEYSNGEDILAFDLTKYAVSYNAEKELFEKRSPDAEGYLFGDKLFFLVKNGNREFWTAAWSDGPLVFRIQGDLSKESLIKIINSLGG